LVNLIKISTRLRAYSALQAAFGGTTYSEQPVVQETLDDHPAENVSQTEQALDTIIANIVKDISMIILFGSSECRKANGQ
jgi:hypothetical protein